MVKVGGGNFIFIVLRVLLRVLWAILTFAGRILRRFFLAVGVCVVLVFLGYVGFEFIIKTLDSRYSGELDAYLKERTLAFPLEKAGEIAGKTGTATNADGKTSDVWLLLFAPGPPEHPEAGVMLGFWMGKDSKAHSLGERGSTGGPGFAETGGRNWVHSAATVLAFLQTERGLLKPGYKFQPLMRDDVLANLDAEALTPPGEQIIVDFD